MVTRMGLRGRIRTAALERLRQGQRQVSWVPDWMGWGNNAYQWLWAYQGQRLGEDRVALLPDRHAGWGRSFPAARRSLLVSRSEVKLRDRRVTPWVGEDRGRLLHHVDDFVRDCMLPGSALKAADHDELTVNVRRGDYYSDPVFRAQFGMPVETYLREAVMRAVSERGLPSAFHVVSDGVAWCRENLSWLAELAPVTYEDETRRTPVSDLFRVAGSRRVVIMNSTFSYWACYIGDVLHESGHQVVAPAFFRRDEGGSRSHHLRSSWSTVEEIPGGWDALSDNTTES